MKFIITLSLLLVCMSAFTNSAETPMLGGGDHDYNRFADSAPMLGGGDHDYNRFTATKPMFGSGNHDLNRFTASACVDKKTMKQFTDLAKEFFNTKITLKNFVAKLFTLEAKKMNEITDCLKNNSKLSNDRTFLSKLGYSLLFASNCAKDVGPALIILDQVIALFENSQWKDALTNSVVFGVISYQSFNDCKAAAEAIRQAWM